MTTTRVALGCAVLVMSVCMSTIGRAADDAGQRLYEAKCSGCHGPAGRDGGAPKLVPFKWSDREALELIRAPLCDMPPIPESDVSDEEIAEIIAYLRTVK